jgi:hypothetical protein
VLSYTVTMCVFSFFKVMFAPCAPCHPLLHTFFSSSGIMFLFLLLRFGTAASLWKLRGSYRLFSFPEPPKY